MTDPTVAATALKLPAFWTQDPELWFVTIEAQFSTKGIVADQTKYEYLVASLSPATAAEVRDVLLAPPANDRYQKLKESIVARTTSSQQKRLQLLLTAEELGDRTPSQLLRHMQQLVGQNTAVVGDDLMKQLFIQRLPQSVQAIIASQDRLTVTEVAALADKIVDVTTPAINSVQNAELASLRQEVAELKNLLTQRGRSTERTHRGNSQRRQRSKSNGRGKQNNDICWYHNRFGANAQKCTTPCKFEQQQGNASGSH